MPSPSVLFPRHAEGVLERKGASELILLDPESGFYYTLDEVGGRIWELCDGKRPQEEIAGVLAGEYDAPRETIAADVAELVEDLARENLIADAG